MNDMIFDLRFVYYTFLSFFIISFQLPNGFCLESIKTGKFKAVGNIDNIIIRNNKEQIESFNNNTSYVVSEILWTNNREYVLTIKQVINCQETELLKIGAKMKVTILECTEEYYTCQVEYGKGMINVKYLKLNAS